MKAISFNSSFSDGIFEVKTLLNIGVFAVLAGLMACHHLRLAQAPSVSATDWRFYGGTRERTNASLYEIKPPLTVAWEYDASAGFGVYSASAVDNLLFVGTLKGEVHVIDIQTGHGMGVNDFGSAVAGTPIPDGALMYVALAHREKSLVAFNVTNGATPWGAKLGDIETSPLLDGDRLFVTTANGKIVCLGKKEGMPVWEYAVPPHPRPVLIHSSPASDGNVVVFGCDDGSIVAVGSDDGQPRWRAKTGQSIMASPSIRDSVVYVGSLDSTFYAFHAKDGKLLWKRRLGTKIFASQAVGQDRVYVGTVGGILYALNRETGAIDWTFTTNSVISAAPLLSGNILYAGCLDKNLYALDAKTGDMLWSYKAEGRIKTMPIAYRDFLIILEDNRTVLCLKESK